MSDLNELVAKEIAKSLSKKVNIDSMAEKILAEINVKAISKALTDDLIEMINSGESELYLDYDSNDLSQLIGKEVSKFLKGKLK